MQQKQSKKPLLVIFFTIFMDLIGFGIVIPLSPYLAKQFGASELQVGILQASYSLMQFVFAPMWGRLSDKYGRRPIMLISILGGALSFTLFAFSNSLWLLILARSMAGAFGGNISAASAYIADITPKESRSKNMGLIGAAFGLGFIFGPVMGGLLSEVGQHLGTQPPLGVSFSSLGAAALGIINFIFAYKYLKESRSETAQIAAREDRLSVFMRNLKKPAVGRLMIAFFFSGFAMAHMESMLFLYVKDKFNWSLQVASYGFAFVGIMIVFTQGYLIRKLIPKFGERRILTIGLALAAIGIAGIGFSSVVWVLALVNMSLAIGIGMSNPSALGSISILSDKDEQGSVMGVTQSLAAIGRILGPVSGGFLYQTFGSSMPFFTGGGLMCLGILVLLPVYAKLPQSGRSSSAAPPAH